MRKVLLTLVIACVAVLAVAGLASGATKKHCGTLYTPKCRKPTITVRHIPPQCKKPSSTFTLPTVKIHSIAGIRKIQITVGSTVVYTKSFKGIGPQNWTIKGLKVSAKGLAKGGHSVKIFVKDINGKTASDTLHFTVCAPKPVFTG